MPRSHLPSFPAVRAGDLLFISGQASVDATGCLVPGTFEQQMRRSLEDLRAILLASGSDHTLVVQPRNCVREPGDLESFNRIYRDCFSAPYPARTTLTRCLGEELRYETDCIAVIGGAANE